MNTRNLIFALCTLPFLGFAGTAAAEGTWSFDVDASAGARYDSNVGIPDLDTSSGEADSVILLAGGGSLTWTPTDSPFALRVGYDYSGTSYGRFEMFDLDLHHGVAELQFRNTFLDATLAFDQYEGVLDGEDYVSIGQVSPALGHLFGNRVYVRAAWIGSTRDYDVAPERNATNSAMRLDAYLLLDNMDRYVSFNVQRNDESAASSEFDYQGTQIGLAYAQTFETQHMRLEFKSSLRFEDRDYAFETPAIGERRRDRRWRAAIEAEVPFSDHVALMAMLEHTDNASNLDTAVLEKSVAGLELRLAF